MRNLPLAVLGRYTAQTDLLAEGRENAVETLRTEEHDLALWRAGGCHLVLRIVDVRPAVGQEKCVTRYDKRHPVTVAAVVRGGVEPACPADARRVACGGDEPERR